MLESGSASAAPVTEKPATQAASNGTPGESGTFKVPEGQRLVSQADYDRLTQTEGRFKGVQPFYNKLSAHGIKDEKSFERLAPVLKKFGIERLAALAAEDAAEDGGGSGGGAGGEEDRPLTRKEAEAYFREQQSKWSEQEAMKGHESARATEWSRLSDDAAIKEAFGGDVPEALLPILKDAAAGAYYRSLSGNQYPEGHPLHGKAFAPLGEKLGSVFEGLKGLRGMMSAQALSEIANKAASQPGAVPVKPGTGETTATVKGGKTDFGDELTQAALSGLRQQQPAV